MVAEPAAEAARLARPLEEGVRQRRRVAQVADERLARAGFGGQHGGAQQGVAAPGRGERLDDPHPGVGRRVRPAEKGALQQVGGGELAGAG